MSSDSIIAVVRQRQAEMDAARVAEQSAFEAWMRAERTERDHLHAAWRKAQTDVAVAEGRYEGVYALWSQARQAELEELMASVDRLLAAA